MKDLKAMLAEMLLELESYPVSGSGYGYDDDVELKEGHPLCDIGRRVVRAIPDSRLDETGAPNFPELGGRLWYQLLRISRTSRDETKLEETALKLSRWIRLQYGAMVEARDGQRFDAFLSHNSMDKPVVRELADALVARGLRPWLDERELVPGRMWQEALEDIIQTTKTAVVMFGPAGLGPWEQPEMRACLNEFVSRKLPVIPVLLPGATSQPSLPLFMRAFTWVDMRDGLSDVGLDRLQWGITGQKSGSPPLIANAAREPTITIPSTNRPLEIWREKLDYLRQQEAIAADPAQKFALKKHIEEAEAKLRELND